MVLKRALCALLHSVSPNTETCSQASVEKKQTEGGEEKEYARATVQLENWEESDNVIPVSRPSFSKVSLGMRSIHLYKWQKYGLETGIMEAAAATLRIS